LASDGWFGMLIAMLMPIRYESPVRACRTGSGDAC
jgi:hypothetical protein